MSLLKAIELLAQALNDPGSVGEADLKRATLIAFSAMNRIKLMRSYNIPMAMQKLSGETQD